MAVKKKGSEHQLPLTKIERNINKKKNVDASNKKITRNQELKVVDEGRR